MKRPLKLVLLCFQSLNLASQSIPSNEFLIASTFHEIVQSDPSNKSFNQFFLTSDFLNAAINSFNSLNSLVKKENYRIKVASFNNPTSSDLGFNLENEIQTALKPLLLKAKNVNSNKFSQIVSSIIGSQPKTSFHKSIVGSTNPIFTTIVSMVGTLTIQEKRITREDLDTFVTTLSRYFVQYEKLNLANEILDQNLEVVENKIKELQFDIKEYILEIILVLYPHIPRLQIKNLSTESLFLQFLDKSKIEISLQERNEIRYPSDGIKTAKEIAYALQKIFNEYQKLYTNNYEQIRNVLLDSKSLGKNIDSKQIQISLKDLESLFNESKISDVESLRLSSLFERLKLLSATDQLKN